MAAAGVDAALDLDEDATVGRGEVGAPFAGVVEAEFADERRAVGDAPEEGETGFGAGHGGESMKDEV